VKKRKKFDKGGSVMDKPDQDMRNPAYRKQLEREQALESSSPETMLVGPVRGVSSLRGLSSNILKGKKPPKGPAPEIGSKTKEAYIKREVDALKTKYPDAAENEVQKMAKTYGEHEYRKNAPVLISKKEQLKKDIGKASEDIGRRAVLSAAVPGRKEEKEDKPDWETGGMKKGGTVSASRRADGIAQRGKTKGRMV